MELPARVDDLSDVTANQRRAKDRDVSPSVLESRTTHVSFFCPARSVLTRGGVSLEPEADGTTGRLDVERPDAGHLSTSQMQCDAVHSHCLAREDQTASTPNFLNCLFLSACLLCCGGDGGGGGGGVSLLLMRERRQRHWRQESRTPTRGSHLLQAPTERACT